MTKYEFKVINEKDYKKFEDVLNRLGKQGWGIAGLISHNQRFGVEIILQREIPTQDIEYMGQGF